MATDAGAGTGGGTDEGEAEPLPGAEERSGEYWPPWWKKYLNDFRSHKHARANDGMRSPRFDIELWTGAAGATTPTVLDAARRRHDQAEARMALAEQRSERLAQRALALLALTFVSVGYQASALRDHHAPALVWVLAMGLGGSAIVMLALAAVEAIGVDRVGYVQPAEPGRAAEHSDEGLQRQSLVSQEHLAALMANWSARNKVNEFLQARAWLTRGITALVLSGIVAVGVWTSTGDPQSQPAKQAPRAGRSPKTPASAPPSVPSTTSSLVPRTTTSTTS